MQERDAGQVLFDLDGTLLDHSGASNAAILCAVEVWLPEVRTDSEEVLRLWSALEQTYMAHYLSGEMDFAVQRRRRLTGLLAGLGHRRDWSDEVVDNAFRIYLAAYERHWRCFADASETIARLAERQIPMAVLSNGDRIQQASKLASLDLPVELALYVPADVEAAKPARSAFTRACHLLNWDVTSTIYVGDSLTTDARASADAGLRAVWINRRGDTHGDISLAGVSVIDNLRLLVGMVSPEPPSRCGRFPA